MNSLSRWSFRSLLLAACFSTSLAFADSDSAFCAAPSYLAYELRAGTTPGVGGQVLRVVRFEPPHGIYLLGEAKLEDFQPHRMICSKDRIEISGWAKEFHKYVIEIAAPDKVNIVEHTKDAARRFDPAKDGPEPLQLGYSKPQTIILESPDPDHTYELRISDEMKQAPAGLQHHRQAELVQLDQHRNIRQRVMFYDRDWLETAD